MSKIYIYDQIGGNGIVALDVIKQLSDLEGDIDVHINSGGGSVSQGIAIYNALKEHEGQVNVFIDGLAASIASIIAMAGDTITMAEGSLMMVHEVWTEIAGNAGELRKEAEVLEKHTDTILDIYESNTPLSRDEIRKMLEAETWLTADEAYELGIATDISGALKQAASVNVDSFTNAPKELEAIIALNTKSLEPEPEPEKSDPEPEQPQAEEDQDDHKNLSMVPTAEMAAEATRGLEWRAEYNRGGTEVGVARARDIKNRETLSQDTVNRMISYFARHEVDKEAEGFRPGEDGYPSAGRIAWALWGGDAGKSWANARREDDSEAYHDPEEEEEKNFTDKEFVARLEAAKQRLATLTKLAKL